MTFVKAFTFIAIVMVFNYIGQFFGLYSIYIWYDMPMHFAGGFAIGTLAIAIWQQGIEEVRFKGRLAKHLKWWMVPIFVISFTALVATVWEFHEFALDVLLKQELLRQVSMADTMSDFFLGLLGSVISLIVFNRKK